MREKDLTKERKRKMTNNAQPKEVSIEVWYRPGGSMMYNRYHLSPRHPEYVYNYFKREYPDLKPEDYGIENPLNPKICCPKCGEGFHLTEEELRKVTEDNCESCLLSKEAERDFYR